MNKIFQLNVFVWGGGEIIRWGGKNGKDPEFDLSAISIWLRFFTAHCLRKFHLSLHENEQFTIYIVSFKKLIGKHDF